MDLVKNFKRKGHPIVDVLYFQVGLSHSISSYDNTLEDLTHDLNSIRFDGFDDGIRYRVKGIDVSSPNPSDLISDHSPNAKITAISSTDPRKELYASLLSPNGIDKKLRELELDPAVIIIGMRHNHHIHDVFLARSLLDFCSTSHQTLRNEIPLEENVSLSTPDTRIERPQVPIVLGVPKAEDEIHVKAFYALKKTWRAEGRLAYCGIHLHFTTVSYGAHKDSDITFRNWMNLNDSVIIRAQEYLRTQEYLKKHGTKDARLTTSRNGLYALHPAINL